MSVGAKDRKANGGSRTPNLQITSQVLKSIKRDGTATCDAPAERVSSTRSSSVPGAAADPDLRRLVEAWPTLPDSVRAGIPAMIEATAGA